MHSCLIRERRVSWYALLRSAGPCLDRLDMVLHLTCFWKWVGELDYFQYDAVSDVVESGVHWRSDFQIGSRVLKICFKPIFMHIYGMQYDFMHRSC